MDEFQLNQAVANAYIAGAFGDPNSDLAKARRDRLVEITFDEGKPVAARVAFVTDQLAKSGASVESPSFLPELDTRGFTSPQGHTELPGFGVSTAISAEPQAPSLPQPALGDFGGLPEISTQTAAPLPEGSGKRAEFLGRPIFPELSERALGGLTRNMPNPNLSRSGNFARRADELNTASNALFARDPNESFLTNLLDFPLGAATALGGTLNSLGDGVTGLGTTGADKANDNEILSDIAEAAANAGDAAANADQAAKDALPLAELPDLGLPQLSGLDAVNGASQGYNNLANAYADVGASLTAPPELGEEDFQLANFLSIINRGTLQPEWRDLAQYELQSGFEARRAELTLGAAQATAEGDQVRAKTMLESANESKRITAKLQTDRKAYAPGAIGDYHFGRNSGNNDLSAKGVLELIRTQPGQGEGQWVQAVTQELELPVESLTFDGLKSAVMQSDAARIAARSLNLDFDKALGDDVKLIEMVNAIASNGVEPGFVQGLAENIPGLAEVLQIDDPNAFQNYLTPEARAGFDSVMNFNAGGSQTQPAAAAALFRETRATSKNNYNNLRPEVMSAATKLVELNGGNALTINSAWRSQADQDRIRRDNMARNNGVAVGVAKKSRHTHGDALDVSVNDMSVAERRQFLQNAYASGFRGFGFYGEGGHVHLDLGNNRTWGPKPEWASGFNHQTGTF